MPSNIVCEVWRVNPWSQVGVEAGVTAAMCAAAADAM